MLVKKTNTTDALRLPTRWDFLKQKVLLTRVQIVALQTELSKMSKEQIEKHIDYLQIMENEKKEEAKKYKSDKIVIPEKEKQYQEAYKWAFYCREAKKFAEYYFKSLTYQHKI